MGRVVKRAIVFGGVALATASAAADPCIDRANDVIARYPGYVTYCEACGDRAPSEPAIATRGHPLELAHTYMATSPQHFENLAALAGCPVTGVPPTLRVTSETASGVLITPDWAPVQRAEAPAAPAPVVVAATQLVFVPVDDGPPWALLAGIAGLATGATGMLCAFALRRRHRGTQLPRALDLTDRLLR